MRALQQRAYVFVAQAEGSKLAGVVQQSDGHFQFDYADAWLDDPDAFPLDPLHLPLSRETIRSPYMFGAFMDAVPERWGKRVHAAMHRHVPRNEIEWLLAVRGSGVGVLRFSGSSDRVLDRHPVASFDDLVDIAAVIAEIDVGATISKPAVLQLLRGGLGMGGARPKTVVTHRGREWLAKFGRRSDTHDEVRAEHASLAMAKQIGIQVPQTELVEIQGQPVLLIERFDRDADGTPLHYLSAHTLLGMHRVREEDVYGRYSYAGIADIIKQLSDRPEADCHELFRRMVLNVVIGNTDDHLRNHGFSYHFAGGFRLSPVFDVVPQPQNQLHAIGVGPQGRASSLQNAISAARYFLVSIEEVRAVANRVLLR
ncbi:type II toxin-antitoxin system HipA family toxin [Chitinolyticbacter meiyuanensis]|uniref:type II toxin-antitoxin system HipA family toxin n=1 Tax=Chitinolyticbacter meiyuanensis TaxID=682798 RepID=UPI0011E5DD1C|nr:type II toxin-antitoxin system HipA family toxin [Chitinolyticbacter meiyuanensis]